MSIVTDPATTAGGMIGGHYCEKAVDAGTKFVTGRTWADNVTQYTRVPI